MKIKYTYTIPDIWGMEERQEFKSEWDSADLTWVAEEAAQDFYQEREGWEVSNWPIELHLYDEEGVNLLGKFLVNREAKPVFYARKIKT